MRAHPAAGANFIFEFLFIRTAIGARTTLSITILAILSTTVCHPILHKIL